MRPLMTLGKVARCRGIPGAVFLTMQKVSMFQKANCDPPNPRTDPLRQIDLNPRMYPDTTKMVRTRRYSAEGIFLELID
jgi:hypothetical protein